MIYLLDSSICIRYLNGRSPAVRNRLESLDPGHVNICSVVKAELLYGAAKSQAREETLARLASFFSAFKSSSFDDSAAVQYAEIRADLENKGTPIGPNDLMIAAIALAHRATLVTSNTREFARVINLQIDDWETPL